MRRREPWKPETPPVQTLCYDYMYRGNRGNKSSDESGATSKSCSDYDDVRVAPWTAVATVSLARAGETPID